MRHRFTSGMAKSNGTEGCGGGGLATVKTMSAAIFWRRRHFVWPSFIFHGRQIVCAICSFRRLFMMLLNLPLKKSQKTHTVESQKKNLGRRHAKLRIQLLCNGDRDNHCASQHLGQCQLVGLLASAGLAKFQLTSRAINETFHTVCLYLTGWGKVWTLNFAAFWAFQLFKNRETSCLQVA